MTEFDLIKLTDQSSAISDRLAQIVKALRLGQIPPEVVAPLIPILDARIPPLLQGLVEFGPPLPEPWFPPWRTSPPNPDPLAIVSPPASNQPMSGVTIDVFLDETE